MNHPCPLPPSFPPSASLPLQRRVCLSIPVGAPHIRVQLAQREALWRATTVAIKRRRRGSDGGGDDGEEQRAKERGEKALEGAQLLVGRSAGRTGGRAGRSAGRPTKHIRGYV